MKISSKERNYLRKLAHDIDPVVRMGKLGLNEEVLESIRLAIDKRELIKVKILQNSSEEITRDLENIIEKYANCITISSIGSIMIFFKPNKKGNITKEFLEFRKSSKNV